MNSVKSHLLAYLKHTEGFEKNINILVNMNINEILDYIKEQDMFAYNTVIFRFKKNGVDLKGII